MPTTFFFGGKSITEPGVYVQIKSGITQPSVNLDYGKVLLIDSGSGSGWGGAGINSELASSAESIVQFADLDSVKQYMRGGLFWKLSESLFRPNGFGSVGISQLTVIKAATTTAPTISIPLDAADDIQIKVRHEGSGSNGVLSGFDLVTGFAVKLRAGLVDPTKYIMDFYRGTYSGTNDDGSSLTGLSTTDSTPLLLLSSIEVSTVTELVTWMSSSSTFNTYFKLNSLLTVTGALNPADLTNLTNFTVAVGGTEVYGATDFDDAVAEIEGLDFSIVLSDQSASDAGGAENFKILAALTTDAAYKKMLFVGGGDDADGFASESVAPAAAFDSDLVAVVHSGVSIYDPTIQSARDYSSLYHAAAIVGRIAGLSPQTPITFKAIGIDGVTHVLSKVQRLQALKGGVINTNYDDAIGGFIVNQGINTLQNNTNVVNTDGRSHSIQVTRISSQLIRELTFNAKRDLFGNQEQGPNRGILTPADVKSWTEGFLQRRTATQTTDNLIISFEDVTATIQQDAFFVSFKYQANYEVNKMFFTAFLLQ